MHSIKCGFCRHDNPPDSKFCNACGAPLTAAPCPHCGAPNDATATTCQHCGASLPDSLPNDLFLPLPSEEALAHSRPVLQTAEAMTQSGYDWNETPDLGLPLTARSASTRSGTLHDVTALAAGPSQQADVADDFFVAVTDPEVAAPPAQSRQEDFLVPFQPEPPETPAATTQPPETRSDPDPVSSGAPASADDVQPTAAVLANTGSEKSHGGSSRGSGRRILTSALIVAVLAAAVIFAYRHFQRFQPSDAVPPNASTGEPIDRGIQVTPKKPVAATGAASATVAVPPAVGPPASAPASDRAAAAIGQTKATGGERADAKGSKSSDGPAASAARPQSPADIFIRPEPDPRSAPPVQEGPRASTAGTGGDTSRPSTSKAGAGVGQRPAGAAPCTDAQAALGLCSQENTKGRKP
jgi:hypothetical protein